MSSLPQRLMVASREDGFLPKLETEVSLFKQDKGVQTKKELLSEMGIPDSLFLCVSMEEFDLIKKGALYHIFRKYNSHIKARLYNTWGIKREYNLVEVRRGKHFTKESAFFKYEGFHVAQHDHSVRYGNIKYDVIKGDFVIKLGDIVNRL